MAVHDARAGRFDDRHVGVAVGMVRMAAHLAMVKRARQAARKR